jgi:hypothetical protein
MDVAGAGAVIALLAVAAALLARRPRHAVTLVLTAHTPSWILSLTPAARLYSNAVWKLGPPLLSMLLVVFPDGPRGRWWRRVLAYQIVVAAAVLDGNRTRSIPGAAFPLPAARSQPDETGANRL